MEWQWLVAVVAVPIVSYLANAVRVARNETAAVAKDLADYKLTVAKEYASVVYLKDVETRLTATLDRIEKKLDRREAAHG